MKVKINIELEVSEDEVLADIITNLETTLPYFADNVVISSKVEE